MAAKNDLSRASFLYRTQEKVFLRVSLPAQVLWLLRIPHSELWMLVAA